MTRGHAFKFYPEVFLEQVKSLGYEDRGKYITLLCFMRRHGKMREVEIKAIVSEFPGIVFDSFKMGARGYWRIKGPKDQDEDIAEATIQQEELFSHVAEKNSVEKFAPPGQEQVKACFIIRGLQDKEAGHEAEKFIAHYTRTNWKTTRGTIIVDWNAAITTWLLNKKEFSEHKPHKTLTQQWLE